MIHLFGKPVKEKLLIELKARLSELSVVPKLVIIQIGHNEESNVYIRQKKLFGESIGVSVEHTVFEENISEDELLKNIETLNADESITGIIIQLPIPHNLNKRNILDTIDPNKDVDGLGSRQASMLYTGSTSEHITVHIPATARGIMSLLEYYEVGLTGKHVCIVGRSDLVGKPLALLCLQKNATVTVCHSHTQNLESITRTADILVVATGKAHLIDSRYVRPGQIVIDVGIHRVSGVLCGDVDVPSVENIVSALSPVPGGVGPLTVLSLFQNLLE